MGRSKNKKVTLASIATAAGLILTILTTYYLVYDRRAIIDYYPEHGENQSITSRHEINGEYELKFYAVNWGKSNANFRLIVEAQDAQIRNHTSALGSSASYTYTYVYDQNPVPQPMPFFIKVDPSVDRFALKVSAQWDGVFTEPRYRFDKSVLVFERGKEPFSTSIFNYIKTASSK